MLLCLGLQAMRASRSRVLSGDGNCSQCQATAWFEFTLNWDPFLG